MNIQSAINKELFIPRDERMLVAVEVRRRKRKRMSSLLPGAKGDYTTFICVSVTNTRPHQLLITKVKRFGGSSSFTRRSQWTVEQLRQVNGINPNKDSPEFDLVFDNAVDQWVASSSAEKCIFVQILYHACQTYWEGKAGSLGKAGKLGKVGRKGKPSQHAHEELGAGPSDSSPGPASKTLRARRKSYVPPRKAEFINCQSKLTGDACTMNLVIYRCKAFLNRMKNMMVTNQRSSGRGQPGQRATGSTVGNVVQRVNVSLGERGDRLTRAEDKTVELMHKAHQFADTAHKLALKYSK
ncbi:syntaxin binding protein 6 (amisyn), like [Acanthopagrus latus]|uniref:syntaxin binding protein 6 (amisyn), like n=1 Tax=Acanthopagrus latus TaxID=8177 RepID=UPI00187CEAB8|nr:syntaxin binding protein 6 (amisyn), like [Acanthopagrus latus]XP_036942447.1 syntaxin binding protein 6 (amisyn), like [Acanthopagrus latus]